MSKYVFLVRTKTTQYIDIHEPGAQSSVRKISFNLEEAKDIIVQLSEALYQAGAWKKPETQIGEK